MSNVNSYQLRPHVYVVKQHRTVDDQMLDRMLERRIVPVLDMFPDQPLVDIQPKILLSRPEVMKLSHMKVSQLEKSLDILTELVGVDWVIMPIKSKDQILFAHVKSYQYIRYQAHLHIKHFIKFGEKFTVNDLDLPSNLLEEIHKAETLDELSADIYSYIQKNKPIQAPDIVLDEPSEEPEEEPSDEELESIEKHEFTKIHEIKPIEKETPRVVDDILITQDSLASISKNTDDLAKYKKLHSSILTLQDYLRTNMKGIQEFHSDDCDIAFKGLWHDDKRVNVQSFALSDSRGHSAWYIDITSTEDIINQMEEK